MMSRTCSTILVTLAATGLCTAGEAVAKPATPPSYPCSIGNGHGYGYTRLTSLRVRQAACSLGEYMAHKHANRNGWNCKSVRRDKHSTYYDARESCTSPGAKWWAVQWTYRQHA